MKADAIATRMSVLGRALPSRVLLVDDDELELELMADRLVRSRIRSRTRRQTARQPWSSSSSSGIPS